MDSSAELAKNEHVIAYNKALRREHAMRIAKESADRDRLARETMAWNDRIAPAALLINDLNRELGRRLGNHSREQGMTKDRMKEIVDRYRKAIDKALKEVE